MQTLSLVAPVPSDSTSASFVGVGHLVGNETDPLGWDIELGWRVVTEGLESGGHFFTDTNGQDLQHRFFSINGTGSSSSSNNSSQETETRSAEIHELVRQALGDDDDSEGVREGDSTTEPILESKEDHQRSRALGRHTYPAGECARANDILPKVFLAVLSV